VSETAAGITFINTTGMASSLRGSPFESESYVTMPVFAGAEAASAMDGGEISPHSYCNDDSNSRLFVTRTIVGGLAAGVTGHGLTSVLGQEARGRDFLPNALHRGYLGAGPRPPHHFLRLESLYSTDPAWLMAKGGSGGQTTEAAHAHAQTRILQARSRDDDVESLDKQRCWLK
jgi:hypothetical protein